MHLRSHLDWPRAAENMTRFWHGEMTERPAIHITVAKPEGERVPLPVPESAEQKYFDADFLVAYSRARFSNVWYCAEGLPAVTQALMAGWLPTFGSSVTADDATVWIEERVPDWDSAPDWERAWEDEGWRRLKDIMRRLAGEADGGYFVGLPPVLTPNDLLSVLRGPNEFLMDLALEPERIKHALQCMTDAYLLMLDELIEIVHTQFEGYHHHYPVWSPEPLVTVQSDVSCAMSPAMFEEFIVPELERITGAWGRGIYHLDGPTAVKHLDRVLEIPGVRMLQWVPGAGQPGSFEHWLHIFKRAQQKGRAILLYAAPGQLERVVQEFRPDLTFICCGDFPSLDAAEQAVENLEKWTKQYWG